MLDRFRGRRTARHWAPGDESNAGEVAVFVHFALLLPVHEGVVVLHGDEFGPPVLFGAVLHHHELEGPHAAGADVADFPRFDEVVESLHCFFDGDGGVEAVDLKEVDVGCLQAREGGIDGVEDGLA